MHAQLSRPARWTMALLLTALLVAISYQWLDRPIAYFAHARFHNEPLFVWLTQIPEVFAPLAVVAFIVLGLRALVERPLNRLEAVLLLCALSLVVATAIKNQLKFLFGRTWPETWVRDNPSLIRDGVYGFHPFHGGIGFESFPSGHTTGVTAVMSVLWICYPRFRILYALIVAVVLIGLIGADFHFLSDCIAGAFIGASTGWIVVKLWETGGRAPVTRGNSMSSRAALLPPQRGGWTRAKRAAGWGESCGARNFAPPRPLTRPTLPSGEGFTASRRASGAARRAPERPPRASGRGAAARCGRRGRARGRGCPEWAGNPRAGCGSAGRPPRCGS